ATLAPPVQYYGYGSSKTLLVCLVSDFLLDDVEVKWLSNGTETSSEYITYNVAKEDDETHSAISLISVPSKEWELYSCRVNHWSTAMVISKSYLDMAGKKFCLTFSLLLTKGLIILP
ncbi:pre T-cell antigen receptor alpha, partial [Huso huso]